MESLRETDAEASSSEEESPAPSTRSACSDRSDFSEARRSAAPGPGDEDVYTLTRSRQGEHGGSSTRSRYSDRFHYGRSRALGGGGPRGTAAALYKAPTSPSNDDDGDGGGLVRRPDDGLVRRPTEERTPSHSARRGDSSGGDGEQSWGGHVDASELDRHDAAFADASSQRKVVFARLKKEQRQRQQRSPPPKSAARTLSPRQSSKLPVLKQRTSKSKLPQRAPPVLPRLRTRSHPDTAPGTDDDGPSPPGPSPSGRVTQKEYNNAQRQARRRDRAIPPPPKGPSELHRAAIANDPKLGRRAMHNPNFHIDEVNKLGETALHIAVEKGHLEIVKFLLKHKADMLAANRDNVTPLDLLMAKLYTNDYSVLVGLFRSAALELEQERLQSLYDTRREGPTDKRRWNNADKAISFQQTSKRDLLRFSRLKQGEQAIADTVGADQSYRSTMVVLNGRGVGPTSKAAKKRRDAQELAQERHPVLKAIEDRERLAELQHKFHRTRTVWIHIAVPAYGMEEEIDAFFTREAPMLRMLAEARGVELVFSGILDPTMIEADREHRLAASLQQVGRADVIIGFHGERYHDGLIFSKKDPSTDWVLRAAELATEKFYPEAAPGCTNGQSLAEIEWVYALKTPKGTEVFNRPTFFFFRESPGTRVDLAVNDLRTTVVELANTSIHSAIEKFRDPEGGARLCREALTGWLSLVLPPRHIDDDHTPILQQQRHLRRLCHGENIRLPGLVGDTSAMHQWWEAADSLPILLLMGAPGSGKSLLLASYIDAHHGPKEPGADTGTDASTDTVDSQGVHVVYTSTRASAESDHIILEMLHHVLQGLANHGSAASGMVGVYPDQKVIPVSYPDEVEQALVQLERELRWFATVPDKRLLWVIDIDVSLCSYGTDVRWIPEKLPPNFKVLVAAETGSLCGKTLWDRADVMRCEIPTVLEGHMYDLLCETIAKLGYRVQADRIIRSAFYDAERPKAAALCRWMSFPDPETDRPYYVDSFTDRTCWDLPNAISTEECAGMESWISVVDSVAGQEYCFDTQDNETAWKPPSHPRLAAPFNVTPSVYLSGCAKPELNGLYLAQTDAKVDKDFQATYIHERHGHIVVKRKGIWMQRDPADNNSDTTVGEEAISLPAPFVQHLPCFLVLAMNELLQSMWTDSRSPWSLTLCRLTECDTMIELAECILERIVPECNLMDDDMAWKVFTMVAMSDHGLNVKVLCEDILGICDGVHSLRWVLVVNKISPVIELLPEGLLRFRHLFIEQAVERRYFGTKLGRWVAGRTRLQYLKSQYRKQPTARHELFADLALVQGLHPDFADLKMVGNGLVSGERSHLDFGGTDMPSLSLLAFERVCLSSESVITTIHASGAPLTFATIRALAKILAGDVQIYELKIENSNITPEGVEALCSGIEANPESVLRTLSLGSNVLKTKGAKAVARVIHRFATLDIRDTQIGEAGAEVLGPALSQTRDLTKLVMNSNRIGDRGGLAIAKAIEQNRSLTMIDLGNAALQDATAQAMGKAMKINQRLRILLLQKNKIGTMGGISLAGGLMHNTGLRTLSLRGNIIGAEGAKMLGKACMKTSTLQLMDLSDNFTLGLEGKQHLERCVELIHSGLVVRYDAGSRFTQKARHGCATAEMAVNDNATAADQVKINKRINSVIKPTSAV